MKLFIKLHGYEPVKKYIRKMSKEIDKTFRPLVLAVAKTAQTKAKELAPKRNGFCISPDSLTFLMFCVMLLYRSRVQGFRLSP